MSLSNTIIKVIGIILAIVGLLLILSIVGLGFGVSLQPWFLALIVGVVFLGAGIYIIRGGNFTL